MNTTLLLVLVVFFAFAVSHLITRFASRFVRLTGIEFVVVGVLVGPYFKWELLTADTLERLSPLVSLLLGLAGFVLGLRFRKALAQVDATGAGVASSVLTIVLVGAALLTALVALAPEPEAASFAVDYSVWRFSEYVVEIHFTSTQLWLALALGCAASAASSVAIDATCRRAAATGPATRLITTTGTMAQVIAVVVLGLAMSTARATDVETAYDLSIVEWAVASVGAAVVSGLLFGLFMGRESDSNRIYLATVGLVTFASGVGAALGISPLFMNLLAGATVSATSPHAEPVREQLERLDHPLFVLMMVFAGAHWSPPPIHLWLIPAVYLVARVVARQVTTPWSASLFLEARPNARRLGAGLLSQGIMAVAIGLYAAQRFPEQTSLILTTVLTGVLVSDLFSDRLLHNVLVDAGEAGQVPTITPSTGANDSQGSVTEPRDPTPASTHSPASERSTT